MKKFLLSLILMLSFTFVMAQSVQRTMVLLEEGTGFWCGWCPSAAQGIEDLLNHGALAAVVANHNGDSLANSYSNGRNAMYAINGYPCTVFDGRTKAEGGSASGSTYAAFNQKYQQRIQVPSPVIMSMEVTNSGLDYTVIVTMTKVDVISSDNLHLVFFVTESELHAPSSWGAGCHFVNRMMVPTKDGTVVDFTSGNTQTVTLNFSLKSFWDIEKIEFVAALQNYKSGQTGGAWVKEVLQTIKRAVIDLNVDFVANATVIQPNTAVQFTNNTFGGYVNCPEFYHWEFPGATPDTSNERNPSVTYTECGEHDVTLVVWRGGQMDTVIKPALIKVGPIVNVTAEPNDSTCYYDPITLDATTPDATAYLWTPGGATTPVIEVTAAEYGLGLHNFTVTVTTPTCPVNKNVSVYFDECTGINDLKGSASLMVYPNPNNGEFTLEINSVKAMTADLTIMNTLGSTVYSEQAIGINGKVIKTINLNKLNSGVYFLVLQNGDAKLVQKILVK